MAGSDEPVALAARFDVPVQDLPAVLLDEAAEVDGCRHGIHALWRRLAGYPDRELQGELFHAVLALGSLGRRLRRAAAALDTSGPEEGRR